MIRVLLSLDLIDAEDKRADLYGLLEDAGWQKAKNVDTVWIQEFHKYTPSLSKERLQELRNEIANPLISAYSILKLSRIYYVAQIGNECVISREVVKRDGTIKAYNAELF